MTIRTLETDYPEGLANFLGRYVSEVPSGTAATGIPAEVNHGRWIVKCPFCPSAQQASDADRRFFCVDCKNEKAGGKWLPVLWPKDRPVLEGLLMARPEAKNRNWTAAESAHDLARENKEQGL